MEFSYSSARYSKNEKSNLHGTTINSPDFKKSSIQKSNKPSENFPLIRFLVTTLSLVILVITTKVFPISESKTKKLSQIEENLMSKTKQFIDQRRDLLPPMPPMPPIKIEKITDFCLFLRRLALF